MDRKILAIDLGGSSGRVMLGTYQEDSNEIKIKELHRFVNQPVQEDGHLRWNFPELFRQIKEGIRKSREYGSIDSLAVDTWGVDFGLLDKEGNLLENPVNYRDERTKGMMREVFREFSKNRLYEITGNQFMEINTLFQLYYLTKYQPELLEKTDSLLMMPDLFHYFLCGEKWGEHSIASTTQMLDTKERCWSKEILEALFIPERILPKLVPSGTRIGVLKEELQKELGVGPIQVITAAGHDTQSAMAAIPAAEDDFIFISCGTWSLMGTELDAPYKNEMARLLNLSNEAGAENKISFLKNISGTWLIQESRNQWKREGKDFSFGELEAMARETKSVTCMLDPDAPEFAAPGDMPGRIREYARKTGQQVPETEGEIVRCINESLALKYKGAMEEISTCTGKNYDVIYMAGGGSQSALLCELTADTCGCTVCAGPVEATVLGNMGIQLMSLGAVKDLKHLRSLIRSSEALKIYKPTK